MRLINNIEKERIRVFDIIKKEKEYIRYPLIFTSDYVIVWYINREKEKGIIRYQYNKGICMSIKYKKYNTTFKIRSVIRDIVIEQQFFYYSLTNISIKLKEINLRYYSGNSLKFLRKKKNKRSKLVFLFK